MNRLFIFCFFLLAFYQADSQKYDNNWLWGNFIYDTAYLSIKGNAQATFNNDTIQLYPTNRNMAFGNCYGGISDPDGNLQVYTNGMWIMDTTGHIIQNGDSLNFGPLWESDYSSAINGFSGYGSLYGLIIIPSPKNDSSYYIFHQNIQQLSPFLAEVCMSKVSKYGSEFYLSYKNKKISSVKPMFGGYACNKHANGRDWWFFFVGINSNCIYKYLLTPDTLLYKGVQCIGDSSFDGELDKAFFSQDGNKYIHANGYTGVKIFDFDRCSGELSNYRWTGWITEKDTTGIIVDGVWGAEISFNNRFIYAVTPYRIFQFDLDSTNLSASNADTIGVNDFKVDSANLLGAYALLCTQYGPDGRIYISPTNSQRFFSVIDNPNKKGTLCNFRLRGVLLPKPVWKTLPLYPNYRLGRLIGSACDTLYNDIKPLYTQAPWLKVYPNPATTETQFDYNWVEWEKFADCELQIADLNGKIVLKQSIPRYSSRQVVNIKQLAKGVYTATLRGTPSPSGRAGEGPGAAIALCKLVKE